MKPDVFEELIAYSTMPLARVPRASLRDWMAFLRGTRSLEGVPIAVEDLPVGPRLRSALKRVEPGRLQLIVNELLVWLARPDRPETSNALPPQYLDAFSRLLDACPGVNALLVITRDRFAFRPEVSGETRDEIGRYVRAHYRPIKRRRP